MLGQSDQADEDDPGQTGDEHCGEQLLRGGGELLGELEQVTAQATAQPGRKPNPRS